MPRITKSTFRWAGLLTIALLMTLGAGCDPKQRDCPDTITCGDLTELSCGEDLDCNGSLSCRAAQKLAADGEESACHSAWCDLGYAYKECD